MTHPTLNLLLVDDEDSVREPLARHLRSQPYTYIVEDVANVDEAIQLLNETKDRFDVALIDEVLKEGPNGLDLLRQIKAKYPKIECILFTGWGMQSGLEALHAGAYRYFAKPFNLEELALTIRFAAEQKRIRKEHDYMEALVIASQALTQTTHLDEQIKIVWDFVREQLATPTCFVALYDSQTDIMHFPLSYDQGEIDPLPLLALGTEKTNWGLAGFVIKTGQEQVWSTRAQAEKDRQFLGIKSRISPKGPSESGICLPLRITDTILGALSVQSYEPYAFDQALLNAVRALGNQVAVTLENSQLVIETKQKALNLEKLQNLTIAINSTLDLKDLLTQTCEAVVELSGAEHSGLVLFDPDLARGRVFAEYPPTEKGIGQIIPVHGILAEEQLVFQHKALNIPDLENDISLGAVRDILMALGIRSTLIVPVIFKGNVIASFSLDAMEKPRTFSQAEIDICKRLANQVAVAIENASLIIREQDTTRRIKQQADRLKVLYEIGTELSSSREVDLIWDSIAKNVIRLVGASRSLFLLVDIKGNRLVKAIGQGYPTEHLQGMTMSEVEAGVSGWVLKTKEAALVENAQSDPRNTGKALEKAIDFATAPLIVAPLLIKGQAIGTLTAANSVGDPPFDEDDKELVIMLAAQAAIAYDNAQRMHELEQLQMATEALASMLEPAHVLQQIVESATKVLNADSSAVWSFDHIRNQYVPEELAAHGIPQVQLEKLRELEPRPGGTAETVMENGWVGVADISDPQYSFVRPSTVEILDSIGVKSFEVIALKAGDENLGVLYVEYNRPRDFTEEAQKLSQTFANHAALALKKVRLSNQVRRARDAAAVIAHIVALGKDIQETWDSIVAGTKEALQSDAVTLYRYNEEKQELGSFPAMTGVRYPEKATRLPSVPEHSIVWQVLRGDDLLIIDDATSHPLTRSRRFTNEESIKSLVGIRLEADDQKVGVLFVNYRTKHRFTQDELTHIKLFANQIAVAIRNAQLHERTKRQAETLEGLYRAGTAVTALLTLKEILQRIAEQVWQLVGRRASYTIIRLVENETAKVVAAYPPEEFDHRRAMVPEISFKAGSNGRIGVTGRAIRTGKPQLVNDVDSDNDYIPTRPQIHSELAVPIKVGERVIGVINVDSPELGAFNENDEHTLVSLASYAAIAISNAELHERTKEAGKAITSTLAEEGVLTNIAQQALQIVRTNSQENCFSHIALLDGDKLRFVAASPLEILNDLHQNIGEIDLQKDDQKGIVGYVALTGQSLKVDEVTGNPNYLSLWENIDIHSQISIPLKKDEQIIGVLSIENSKPGAFSDEDVKNIEALAAQAALAIQNARQFRRTERALAARTALAWTGMISSTWRHAIEKHAITIREQLELLRHDLAGSVNKDSIERRLEMMERLANQILKKPLTAPLTAEETVDSVCVNDFIKNRINQLWANQPYKEIALEQDLNLENSSTVRVSVEWLRRAMDILIDNAVDSMVKLQDRRIKISSLQVNHRAEILISDTGRGIPADLQDRLFREPIAKPKGTKGLGMGLLFAHMIVQTYGGEIRLEKTGETGTTMVIALPLEV